MGAKNCPETPRQKMINMMYLVLTAMLALNVAAETLEAFKIVDASLIKTYLNFTDKNMSLIRDFDREYEINEGKVKKWRNLAWDIHQKSDSLIKYIVDIKELLVLGTGAEVKDPTKEFNEEFPYIITNSNDTLILERQDDLNVSPEVMLTKGRGVELQQKIMAYKEELMSLVDGHSEIKANIQTSLDVDDPDAGENKMGDDNYRTWPQKNFYATPVIASITLLSKLQIDVRNAESAVLRHLYNQINASTFKFTGLKATVIPDASYIFQGQEYRAHIFLSAEDTTQELEVYMDGSKTPLRLDGNEAIFSMKPDKPGLFSYKGYINYASPDGGIDIQKPFDINFQVAKPAVTIAPTKMNVLFKNLKNPISLSAAGIPSEKLKPEFNNGKMYADADGWIIEPNELDPNGEKTKVTIYADIEGERRFMGEMAFRVMKVPDPVAEVANLSSGSVSREVLRVQNIVSAKMRNFYFDLKFVVTSFTMTVPTSGGETVMLNSNSFSFTPDQKRLLNGLGAGDKVLIENIKAKIEGVDNDPERPLSPIVLTVQ